MKTYRYVEVAPNGDIIHVCEAMVPDDAEPLADVQQRSEARGRTFVKFGRHDDLPDAARKRFDHDQRRFVDKPPPPDVPGPPL